MKQETVLKICKIINRITIVISILAVLLPIVFWAHIPDTIPTHYGASGKADAWGDKSMLILEMFLVLILLGVMSITTYFVKTNGTSKYATEAEKSSYPIIYPMLVIVNLGVQGLFAYLIYAGVTAKESLGTLFLPIVIVVIFAPIIWFFVKYGKSKKVHNRKEYRQMEELEGGVLYRSKIDWWLAVLLLVPMAFLLYETIKEATVGEVNWVCLGSFVFIGTIIFPLANIKYVLYRDYLKVSCSYYGTERIYYEDIVSVKKTYNPLSSAALSIRRIQIDYVEEGAHKMILISPKNRDEFIEELRKRGYTEK